MRSIARLAGVVTAAAFLLGAAATAANAAAADEPVGEVSGPGLKVVRWIQIVNQRSGLCLEVGGNSKVAGAWVQQRACGSGANQKWQVIDHDGHIMLKVKHSGQCLEVDQAGGSQGLGNNAKLLQWPCHGGAQQQWEDTTKGYRVYLLENRRSGRCLEVDQRVGAGLVNGGGVLQWTCHSGAQQLWRFRG